MEVLMGHMALRSSISDSYGVRKSTHMRGSVFRDAWTEQRRRLNSLLVVDTE